MSNPIKRPLVLMTVLVAGFVTSAQAQRGNHSFGRSGSSGNSNMGSRMEQHSAADRQPSTSFDRQPRQSAPSRQGGDVLRQEMPSTNQGSFSSGSTQRRNNNPGNFGSRQGQGTTPNNTQVYNNTNRNNNNTRMGSTQRTSNNYRYNNGAGYRYPQNRTVYSNHYYSPRRIVYVGAPRYNYVPHNSIRIVFGGYPYYYQSGLFYSYYSGYYEPVFAPFGIHVSMLPLGYYPINVGPTRYYYYDGVYYSGSDNDYEVVDAPLGATVSALPKGAKIATVNGEKFYEFNGTYYKEGTNSKNEVVYTVAGKYGSVNNTEPQQEGSNGLPIALHVGDVIPSLPEGCREMEIDGQHLYVSPDNIYFKAQDDEQGEVSYQVVGIEDNK